MGTVERNYSDPRTHAYLAKLLDEPEKLGLPESSVKLLREGLDAVLTIAQGDARGAALLALNGGVGSSVVRRQYYAELNTLSAQLRAERPEVAELNQFARVIKQKFTYLKDSFFKVVEGEKARGTDVWKTALPWYEHELCEAEAGVAYLGAKLCKVAAAVERDVEAEAATRRARLEPFPGLSSLADPGALPLVPPAERESFVEAVNAALGMEPGPGQDAMLRSLDVGALSLQRRRELAIELNQMKE